MSAGRTLFIAFFLVGLALAATAFLYSGLPDQVPIHWNWHGQVDRYAPKTWGAWLLPGTMAGLLGLFWVLPRISPRQFEIDPFRLTYEFIVLLVIGLLLYMQTLCLAQARDPNLSAGPWLLNGVYGFLALLGNVLGRVRRNFFVGIRVPWTLASERVWNDTHRLAARLVTSAALVGLALGLLGHGLVGLPLLGIALVVPVVYSYFHYKRLERNDQLEPSG